MATALVDSSTEPTSVDRMLVTLSRGTKLVAHMAGESEQFWSIQNVAALTRYLEEGSVFVTCIDSPLYSLRAISEHAAWVYAGVAALFLHGYDGHVEKVEVQERGADAHIVSRDYMSLGDFESRSMAKALASALSGIAKIDIPKCVSVFDFFESGYRSPEFGRVVCLKDFGPSNAEEYFCPVVIGRY